MDVTLFTYSAEDGEDGRAPRVVRLQLGMLAAVLQPVDEVNCSRDEGPREQNTQPHGLSEWLQ